VSNQPPDLPAVLVVDDDPVCRLLITCLLQLHGGAGEIVTAMDGAEALKHCESRAFRLIITDNQMPHLSGLALAAIVKAMGNAVRGNRPLITTWPNRFQFNS
jgi:CheY-like chemotaxis protein